MNKLFVFQGKTKSDYQKELRCAFKLFKKNTDDGNNVNKVTIEKLQLGGLLKNKVDVIVSNGLSPHWYFLLKGLGIVSITFDQLSKFKEYADIVIDYKNEEKIQNFAGKNYSLRGNNNFNFEDIANLITVLKWDSEFFNQKIAYLSCKYLTENIILKINNFVKKERIALIEYLCNCHDYKSVLIAEKNDFHFTDIRLTFEKTINNKTIVFGSNAVQFRLANRKDIPDLKKISTNLYLQSRYYYDNNFERSKVNEFYETWVEKAVLGKYDDECYLLAKKNIPIGYCTIKYLRDTNAATIGICAIAKKFQHNGFGKMMTVIVCNKMFEKNVNKIYVVTQGRNYSAQRLYQSCGFLTKTTELWYHKWI